VTVYFQLPIETPFSVQVVPETVPEQEARTVASAWVTLLKRRIT
jgi:hypothetical protein